MTEKNLSGLFSNQQPVETLTVKEVADWMYAERGSKLRLPPIQRSVVWRNDQVINYWDSLLRGYPAGLMMVHRVSNGHVQGRDAEGVTGDAVEGDFQLFDGQQRMTAILLALGKGQMSDSRKLWIDFGTEPNKSSGLKFQLRMTSTGQPFGYKPGAPNQKIELGKRQDKWKEWRERKGDNNTTPQRAFADATGSDLIDAKCAVSFAEVLNGFIKNGEQGTIEYLNKKQGANEQIVNDFISALVVSLESTILFQKVPSEIVAEQEEYIRFFGRLGQGGTRLSDDELTYSIIKYHYPEIHDRMKEIMNSVAGRLAGEVDLVLAALRVAKTITPWDDANEWEIISRPSPAFVSQLRYREQVKNKFLEMIPLKPKPLGKLESALINVRLALAYENTNAQGLPTMLLARLPHELVDILILFTVKRGDSEPWHGENRDTLDIIGN